MIKYLLLLTQMMKTIFLLNYIPLGNRFLLLQIRLCIFLSFKYPWVWQKLLFKLEKIRNILMFLFFYANRDNKKKWKRKRLYLKSKFCQNAVLYTFKQDKINYIRNHCKDFAFKVIKTQANSASASFYFIVLEIIQDLKNIWDKFDKITKSDAFPYNPKFRIAISNPKKTLDEFLAWFTLAIILLDFINWHEIWNLWRTLSE